MTSAAVRADIADTDVASLLKSITIPPCPTVLASLLVEARRDDVDVGRIARLIGSDVGLAASTIKTANSPIFGLRRKVENVAQAVAVLGLKNVLAIVAGLALRQVASPPGGGLEYFWERSSLHAAACARLARLPGLPRDEAYTFGLFHECGIPLLMQRFADYPDTLVLASQSGRPFAELEFERHATSHTVVGAMLARNWQLPETVAKAIAVHHDFSVLRGESADLPPAVVALVAVSLVAEHLVSRFLGDKDDADWLSAGADAMVYLGLGGDELDDLREEIADELTAVRAARH